MLITKTTQHAAPSSDNSAQSHRVKSSAEMTVDVVSLYFWCVRPRRFGLPCSLGACLQRCQQGHWHSRATTVPVLARTPGTIEKQKNNMPMLQTHVEQQCSCFYGFVSPRSQNARIWSEQARLVENLRIVKTAPKSRRMQREGVQGIRKHLGIIADSLYTLNVVGCDVQRSDTRLL
jgi:hypothetical protein